MPNVDDLDEWSAPPIAGKAHPRDAMDEVVPTLDDSDRTLRHHPNEPMSEGFSYDPESADAAADLAGDLGAEFLEGATEGRDMSDVILSEEEGAGNSPYLVEEFSPEGEETYVGEDESVDIEEPADEEEAVAEAEEAEEPTAVQPPPRKKAAGSSR